MTTLFSEKQQKAIESIWVLGVIVALLQISCYFINSYGPETVTYDYLWRVLTWFLESLIFAWYFYKNKMFSKAIIIQLLFSPYYIFKEDWPSFIDYHFNFTNSALLYQVINTLSFLLPIAIFAVFYFKAEAKPPHISKIKATIIQLIFTLIFCTTFSSDPDSLYNIIGSFSTSNLYLKDALVSTIFIIISLKMISVLVGFFYLSNRIYSTKQILHPLDEQAVTSNFFKWGFLISYPILLLSVLDMGSSAFSVSFSFSSIGFSTLFYITANLVVLFLCGRFFATLIQYRNFTLKRYFGVVNTLSILPVINLATFFSLLFFKQNPEATSTYIDKLKQNRNVHLIIYCALLTLYYTYNYFSLNADYRTFEPLYKLLVFGLSVILLARFKWSTKVIPFLAVIILYYADLKDFFDFADGLWPFVQKKLISFVWIGTVAMMITYYIIDYILHKCFYTPYFGKQNRDEFEIYIDKFK
ncbi:hypothetical protein GJU39_08745 [Pedobacter petrophilus]|uniref:Uncharacterized protein n=1 Tax=Pedobacter petrophilus TaxID=1908241 RepID=A0A7K0FXC4_9SPHI|nr:hypothetical protein [Pedobacter petrophilus]MRX76175.1 hypothetical protein [Pedobacter petrophilus]